MCDAASIRAIENEYEQLEGKSAWGQAYQRIRTEGSYDFTCTEARSAVNRNLNRYRDVLPYDHSRIVIDNSSTNYINASLLKVESVNRSYILAQGPLSSTTPHFWLMIWQQKCKGIIMLNKIIEKNQIKCHQYWPLGENQGGQDELDLPSVNLRVSIISSSTHSHYVYRTMRLTDKNTGDSREILHFHYTTWPDFGVPQSPEAFYKFLIVVRASGCLDSEVGPAVVHCSAGIGRSGTFCLVDSLLMMLAMGLCTGDQGKVLEVLLDMRKARMGLIQTQDQLRFSYQAIIYGSHKISAATNGKDPVESSSSEEPSLNEELPPAPPPRTDSLTRSMTESQLGKELDEGSDTDVGDADHHLSDTDGGEELHDDDDDDDDEDDVKRKGEGNNCAPARPLPPAPPGDSSGSGPDSPTTPDSNKDIENEVRRRHYQEKKSAMTSKVADMVKKQRDTETWDQKKRLIKRNLSLCVTFLVIGLGGGALVYRYFQP